MTRSRTHLAQGVRLFVQTVDDAVRGRVIGNDTDYAAGVLDDLGKDVNGKKLDESHDRRDPKKRECRTLTLLKGRRPRRTKEQRKAGTLSGAAKAASFGYKSVSAQVGRFP